MRIFLGAVLLVMPAVVPGPQSEDFLGLNIWTPALSAADKLPEWCEAAATTPLCELLLDCLTKNGSVDRPWIACGSLLDEKPLLSTLLRPGPRILGTFGCINDRLPLPIAPDARQFFADRFFGDQLAVHQVWHGLLSTLHANTNQG